MAPLYLLHRRSVVARLMTAVAFVMLMPCMAPASDELPKETVLPVGLANKAIQASLEACKKDGYKVSVSVVDRAGVLRAMSRARASRTRACVTIPGRPAMYHRSSDDTWAARNLAAERA